MKKVYLSAIRPKIYAVIYLLSGLFLLSFLFIGFKYLYFWRLLSEINAVFIFVLILFFLLIYSISKAVYFGRRSKLIVAEIDENGLFYYTRLNKSRYIYYVQMKDIYLEQNNKVAVVFLNNSIKYLELPVSDPELKEIVLITRGNLATRIK